jgi:Dolichyl-phosphate-mannose-protein mannosyltransferase
VILSPPLACGKRWLRWETLALAAILVLALGLRLHKITLQGLWYDELDSIATVTGRNGEEVLLPRGQLLEHVPVLTDLATARSFTHVITSLVNDAHPPLYFLTLRFWMDAWGSSDYVIRLLSVLFSLLGIIGLYEAMRTMHGPVAALWAALIMAVAFPQIRYAQEARMYAMAVALEMLAIIAVIRIEHSGISVGRLIALGGGLLGMMFTSYFCAPVCAAIGIYMLVRLRGKNRKISVAVCVATGIIFLATCGPLINQQRVAMAEPGYYWSWDHAPGLFGRTLFRAGGIPLRLLQDISTRSEWPAEAGAVLFVLPFLLLHRRPELLLWGLVLVAPVVFIASVDLMNHTNQLTQIRYLLSASPAVYALLASLLIRQRNLLLRWALPAVAVLSCTIALPVAYEPYKMDVAPVSRYLDQYIRPDEPVIFTGGSWGPYFTGYLYAGLARYSQSFPRPIAFLDAPAPAELMENLRRYPRIWFFCAGPQPTGEYLPGLEDEREAFFPRVGYLHVAHWRHSGK